MVLTQALKAGDRVRLLTFGQNAALYASRLIRFGFLPGVEACLVRRAPLGCPLEFSIRGTSVLLRERELSSAQWEVIP